MPRFFNDTSFWNQPIEPNAEVDPESPNLIRFLHRQDPRGLHLNLTKWTIPIYEVNRQTPRRKVYRRLHADRPGVISRSVPYLDENHPMGHGPGFAEDAAAGEVPIPDEAQADPRRDGHLALVDWEAGWIWDMWAARRREDGEWETNSGMKYRADGPGVFDRSQFAARNGESIHPYGPSRAAGVPALAGTIMHEEVVRGRIEHKLAFATQGAALQRFVSPPACWTDGGWRNGIPEGATLQLDPTLNLAELGLSPGAVVVARALQEYGAVCVDVCGGHTLYGEGLYDGSRGRTWEGLLGSHDLIHILFGQFRVLRMHNVVDEGMGPRKPDGMYAGDESCELSVA